MLSLVVAVMKVGKTESVDAHKLVVLSRASTGDSPTYIKNFLFNCNIERF